MHAHVVCYDHHDNITTYNIYNRADAVLLARLPAGHTTILKAYAHLLDPAADPTCPLCKAEPKTLEPKNTLYLYRDGVRQVNVTTIASTSFNYVNNHFILLE